MSFCRMRMIEKNHGMLPSDKERRRLMKAQAKTNPNYGKRPAERSVTELLNNGMIILDKPREPTSHQVVAWVKKILEVEKVGHGGTLDPNATGVLPIALGNATRSLQVLLSAGKEYVGIMRLHKKGINEKNIVSTCTSFVGDVYQIPPLRSAVKRVRRKRHVYYLDILEIKDDTDVLFRVGCEAGTYVRTLCVDIGKKLRCGAHLLELRRTRVGKLIEDSAVTLHDLKDSFVFWKEEGNEEYIRSIVHPMETLLSHLPKIVVRDSAVDALCHGAPLAIPGVLEVDSDVQKGGLAAVISLKGEGVATVKILMNSWEIIEKDSGVCGKVERVLMNKGTYPSIWKKS